MSPEDRGVKQVAVACSGANLFSLWQRGWNDGFHDTCFSPSWTSTYSFHPISRLHAACLAPENKRACNIEELDSGLPCIEGPQTA